MLGIHKGQSTVSFGHPIGYWNYQRNLHICQHAACARGPQSAIENRCCWLVIRDWLCIWVWSPTFSGRTIYKEDMVFEFTDKCSVIVPLCLNIQSVSYRWSGMGYLLSYARMQYWWHLAQGFSNTLIRALTNNTHVLNDYTHGPFVMVKQLSGPLRSPLADFNLGVIKSHPVFLNNVNSSDKVK